MNHMLSRITYIMVGTKSKKKKKEREKAQKGFFIFSVLRFLWLEIKQINFLLLSKQIIESLKQPKPLQ